MKTDLTKETLAARLNGREMGNEITREEAKEAKAAGLVVVFGYSDDNTEFRGAIHDELTSCDSTTFNLHRGGIISPDDEECDKCRARLESQTLGCAKLRAVWCDKDSWGASWIYRTDIPHTTFDIMENGELYCRGIVFSVNDLPEIQP